MTHHNASRTPISDRIGFVLADLADDADVPLHELADAAGMSKEQLSDYLSGRGTISLDQLAALCEAFDAALPDVVAQAARLAGHDA